MSSWSTLLAASGLRYHGGEQRVSIQAPPGFRCFWATATAWGTFRVTATGATLRVEHGELSVKTAVVNGKKSAPGGTIAEGKELSL
jgi:hypothetical protein